MKGNKAKALNYDIVDNDNCGVLQTVDDLIIYDELSKYIHTETCNSKHNQARKMMKYGKEILLIKCALSKRFKIKVYEGFKVKYNYTKNDKDGITFVRELDNYGG